MSSQSHPDPTAGPSRRSVLRGAGAAGAVGIAAAVGAGAASGVAATRPAADNRANPDNRATAEHPAGAPLVVYLRDAASGAFDVFAGTSRTSIVDPDLAARLTHAVR